MFRRIEEGLPPDASYEANLGKLGFFVNGTGHVRKIQYPDKGYEYHMSNIERHNEVHREAFQVCQREEVEKRILRLGLVKLYLPDLTNEKPDGPCVPILAPPPKILKTKKKVYVVVNDSLQDLGILAYRQLQRELGLNGGSVVNYAKAIYLRDSKSKDGYDAFTDQYEVEDKKEDTPALVVFNPGQLLYSHKSKKPMSLRSWGAQPRKSICHENIQIHDENYVAGITTAKEHIAFVWNHVLKNPKFVSEDSQLYVVAIEDGARNYIELLQENHTTFSHQVASVALIAPSMTAPQIRDASTKSFLHAKARAWSYTEVTTDPELCIAIPGAQDARASSSLPIDEDAAQDIPTIDTEPICPTFAAGDENIGECIFPQPSVQNAILDFFDEVATSVEPIQYHNPTFSISQLSATSEEAVEESQPEQYENEKRAEIETLKSHIAHLRASLTAALGCLPTDTALAEARRNLSNRIAAAEAKLAAMLEKQKEDAAKSNNADVPEKDSLELLAKGGLAEGQEEEARGQWEMQGGGPKVPFAGTWVDSGLLRGAGLGESAEEGEMECDSGVGGGD